MQTQVYTTVDKTSWQRGEWDSEPDKMQWQDEAAELPCLIVRGPVGALCGYVGVPEGHPYFKKDCWDLPVEEHGGLTFADHCQETKSECEGICHKPSEGEPDNVWWLGFDCAHYRDIAPCSMRTRPYGEESYRNISYVQAECASLAAQLKAVAA